MALLNRNQSADAPLKVVTELPGQWGFFPPLTWGYYDALRGDEL